VSKVKRSKIAGKPVTKRIPLPAGGVRIETFIPWTLVKRGVRRKVITPIETPAEFQGGVQRDTQQRKLEKHSPLLRTLGLAHYWQQLLDEGKFRSITEIAAAEGMDVGRVSRILRLVQLSPGNASTILARTSNRVSLGISTQSTIPLDWNLQ
jgi:hypothetical protein